MRKFLFLAALLSPEPAAAQVYTVTNSNDTGPGSLRAAIDHVNSDTANGSTSATSIVVQFAPFTNNTIAMGGASTPTRRWCWGTAR